jgi:hypothetical protein
MECRKKKKIAHTDAQQKKELAVTGCVDLLFWWRNTMRLSADAAQGLVIFVCAFLLRGHVLRKALTCWILFLEKEIMAVMTLEGLEMQAELLVTCHSLSLCTRPQIAQVKINFVCRKKRISPTTKYLFISSFFEFF